MKTRYQKISAVIGILHWILYGIWIIPIIINAEHVAVRHQGECNE